MEGIEFVERILEALARSAGNLTAAEAARLARRSPVRVRHVFTRHTGMSFRAARLRARLAPAPELLVHTSLTMTDISISLRYADRTKFEKAFKRIYGMTPTQYRQRAGEEK